VRDTGYKYSFVGENLAIDFDENEDVIDAWMASVSHRKNILNARYEEIGIAAVEGIFMGEKTIVVAQIFAEPATEAGEAVLMDSAKKDAGGMDGYIAYFSGRISRGYLVLSAGSLDILSTAGNKLHDLFVRHDFQRPETPIGGLFIFLSDISISIFFLFFPLFYALNSPLARPRTISGQGNGREIKIP
jgi:hypothetical protein